MSSSRRSQTVGPFDWPPSAGIERMEAARRWRTSRILRFSERQDRERSWISFKDLTERYGRNISVSEGFKQLETAILAGDFEQDGRCRVLYLHPAVTKTKMTRGFLAHIIEVYAKERAVIERQYLGCCWVPRAMALAWCNSHNVSVKAWLHSNAKQPARRGRPKGSSPIDDSAALEEMKKRTSAGVRARAAAREAVAVFGVRGNSQDADVDRLRRKLAKERKQ